jgi:tetratricopeptide (TPR) repeat protein
LLFLGAALALAPIGAFAAPKAAPLNLQVCDQVADFYLGTENYPEAIRRHQQVLRVNPENALAYYHLGFAYGMVGDHERELADYEKAAALGLSTWDLFLNMGLLYMESGRLDTAIRKLISTLASLKSAWGYTSKRSRKYCYPCRSIRIRMTPTTF